MRTPRMPVVDWTDAPGDLNGLVRFSERRNLVSARVPLLFNWPLLRAQGRESSCKLVTAGAIVTCIWRGALFECRPGHHLSWLPFLVLYSALPGQHLKWVHGCSCPQCYQFVTAIPSCHAARSGVTGPLNELQITDQESCIVQTDVTSVLVVIYVRIDVWACVR
jgi:hypothetical protein